MYTIKEPHNRLEMKSTFFTLLIAISMISYGQSLKKSALEKFNNQEWKEAAKDYSAYLKKNQGDSSDWYNLAFSKSQLNQHTEAINLFKEAKELNFPSSFIYYGIAKSYASLSDQQNTLTTLEEGARNGLAAYARLLSDEAFEPIRDLSQFQLIMDQVALNAYPCLSSEDYRHFDFWIGEWDVYARGGKVGENSITRAVGGCAIHENYITQGNYAGQSINFFDPIDKKWHQHWVGSSGDTYNYIETKRAEGMLQFESPFMGSTGAISTSRLTFTLNEDGTVRQLFESSTDDGKTWSPAFDGLYKKKN